MPLITKVLKPESFNAQTLASMSITNFELAPQKNQQITLDYFEKLLDDLVSVGILGY